MPSRNEEEQFWKQKWVNKSTGWHLSEPQSSLVKYISKLVPPGTENPTVFVPLCGKTVDLGWLRSQGFNVIGCELSEIAVGEVFESLGLTPQKYFEDVKGKKIQVYEHDKLKIYQGNFFDLPNLGNVTGVFDRAALVALPEETRIEYTKYMVEITNSAKQLLIAFEHNRPKPPPHSITREMVDQYYKDVYNIAVLHTKVANIADDITEVCYFLSPK